MSSPGFSEESTVRQTEIRLPHTAENAETTQSPVLPVSWRLEETGNRICMMSISHSSIKNHVFTTAALPRTSLHLNREQETFGFQHSPHNDLYNKQIGTGSGHIRSFW